MKKIFKVLATQKRSFCAIALVAVIGFSFTTCDDDTGDGGTTVSVTGVSLNKSSLSLAVGGSETLTATVAPDNATNKNVTWTTSDATKATVSKGVVTAVATGKATITVTTADRKKTATCSVTVTGGSSTVSVTGVSLNKTSLSLAVGGSETLTATVAPNNATNKAVTWTTSDATKATVSNGVVTAVAAGSATITVKTADGNKTATCAVTVTGGGTTVSVTGVSLNKSSLSLAVGGSETLTATVAPNNATNKNVTWTSSDATKATVADGVITAVATGTATITVTTADGNKTATCAVVTNKVDPTITAWPTAAAITYGAALSTSTLSGGTSTQAGTFAWTEPTTIPTVYNNGYSVTFTPTDTVNYNTVTNMVSITVNFVAGTAPEMLSIPAGTFTMGSPESEPGRNSDETQHSVTLNSFKMSKYQVTQEQYQAVMGSNPSYFTTAVYGESGTPGKLPVEYVSWYDALVFCNKLSIAEGLNPVYSISGKTNPSEWGSVPTDINSTWDAAVMDKSKNGYRLPTEAEWEYACRAGTTTAYNTGDTINYYDTGWYYDNSVRQTHQVGLMSVNAWGLYDMHGNVSELCWDWYGNYSSSPANNPIGADSGPIRVVRGGDWGDFGRNLRSACRGWNSGGSCGWSKYIGFRLVRP